MKYFIYEEGHGFRWYDTEEKWKSEVKDFDFLGKFCDDGWSEEVTQCYAGKCPSDIVIPKDDFEAEEVLRPYTTHEVEQYDRRERPMPDEFDEDGCDKTGLYWQENWSHVCAYTFCEVKNHDEK